MKYIILVIGLIFIFNTGTGELFGQVNLKEMRKKEKERRKDLNLTSKPGERSIEKVASTKERYGFTQIVSHTGDGEASETDPEKKRIEIPEKRDPKNSQEYWQDQKRRLDNQIAELETKIKMAESEINRLQTQYFSMDLAIQANQLRETIDKMINANEADKQKLQELKRELDDLPDKARKAGVPSGWVR